MNRIKATLLKKVGGIKENMSAFLTAVGAAAIPLAIIFVVEIPGAYSFTSIWGWIALALFTFGAVVIYKAWKVTKEEEKNRLREAKTSLYVITSIAKKLDVDMDDLAENLKRYLDKDDK